MRRSPSTAKAARDRRPSRGTQRTTWVRAWTREWPQAWPDQAWETRGGVRAVPATLPLGGTSGATPMPFPPSSTISFSLCTDTGTWATCPGISVGPPTWPRCSHQRTWEAWPCTATAQTGGRKTPTGRRAAAGTTVHATQGSCSGVRISVGTVLRCSERRAGICLHRPGRAWTCIRRIPSSCCLMLALASRAGTTVGGRDSSGHRRATRRRRPRVLWVAGRAGSSAKTGRRISPMPDTESVSQKLFEIPSFMLLQSLRSRS
mmetsp:Transcript_7958/g.17840  ORF Transcript_7958/g.17840 Transcript_7958/m.17840 type:complete len:261 (+) Transcript_7958:796-1578(+)